MDPILKGELVFLRILIPLLAGIIAAIVFPLAKPMLETFIVLIVILTFILYCLHANYQRYKLYQKKWIAGVVFHLLMVTLGYFLTSSRNELLQDDHFSGRKFEAYVVTIVSEPKQTGDILRFEAEVKQGVLSKKFSNVSGKILIALKTGPEGKSNLQYGDELLIPSQFQEVDPPFNPFEFDFKRYLSFRNIYHQSFLSAELIRVIKHDQENSLLAFSIKLRQKMVNSFAAYLHDKDALAVASTLILGYRANLSPEILSAYSSTGTMHVLSVSGMHVILILQILTAMLFFLRINKRLKQFQSLLIIALIWYYSMLTGFSPSVCRAAVMITILVIGKAWNKKSNSYNMLAASAVILLLYNPYYITDAGFQLSYLAVFSLIYFNPKIYQLVQFKHKAFDKLWKSVSLCIAAQLVTFPLAMYYFNQFPLYFLFGNLFIALPVDGIMASGLAFLAATSLDGVFGISFKPVIVFLAKVLEFFLVLSNKGLGFIERLPNANLSFSHYQVLFYILLLVLVIAVPFAVSRRSKKAVFLSAGLTALLFLQVSYTKIKNRQTERLIFYSLRKNTAFSYFQNSQAFFYSDSALVDKTFSFSIKPSIQAVGAKMVLCDTGYSYKGLFCFNKFRVLLWDRKFDGQKYGKSLKVNAVVLSHSPGVKIAQLKNYVQSDLLLIDATNPEYKIRKWISEAKDLRINYYVLKKNSAYVVDLTGSKDFERFNMRMQ